MASNLIDLMVYTRLQTYGSWSFVEFYVAHDANHLSFPRAPLKRFQGRSKHVLDLRPIYGPPLASHELTNGPTIIENTMSNFKLSVYTTDSRASGLSKKTHSDIIKNGTWASYHDVVPKGGPVGPCVATYFGLNVDPLLYRLLYHSMSQIWAALKIEWPTINAHPFVVYHGTARSAVKSILDNGLRATDGMLGHAIYFGSFWKAFRFATLTQDYKKRPGAILRCYAFWTLPYFMPQDKACACKKCVGSALGALGSLGIDHDGRWQSLAECVFLYPWPSGPIKNEEYACIDAKKIMIDSVGHCEASTEHHEPLRRDLVIQ